LEVAIIGDLLLIIVDIRALFFSVRKSIGTKIILPYFLLTLVTASAGAFVVTNLVTSSLQERFENQLLDAGRVVAESMVEYERNRLSVLRAASNTLGVAEAVRANDPQTLDALLPQLIGNSDADNVAILDLDGNLVYAWEATESGRTALATIRYSQLAEVQALLAGEVDAAGNRRALLSDSDRGPIVFTAGPLFAGTEQVGAILTGMYLEEMARKLTETAVARVTVYNTRGMALASTLAATPAGLHETPAVYQRLAESAADEVHFRNVEALNQSYRMAYGDWRLRGESLGFYSVALPSNFIVRAGATSRNLLSLYFSLATVAVLLLGYIIARRIIKPLNRLVTISTAVTAGDLQQRTGIERSDEIGTLATAFDRMTESLVTRNRQLLEQASNLEAIVDSIADGIIVLDQKSRIISLNPTAAQILNDVAHDLNGENGSGLSGSHRAVLPWLQRISRASQGQRYQVGPRVFSALPSPVRTPLGELIGRVIVMRDITREVEVEELQNSFITNISHELRTPLTAVKGYANLLRSSDPETLGEKQQQFASIIEKHTDQLIAHVETLIDISEIQANTLTLQREPLPLAPLLGAVAESWRQKMAGKEIALTLELIEEDLRVEGDATRLRWALDNLLQNAHDYTPEGGQVDLTLFRQDGEARVAVSDNGLGIRHADRPYLFDRFFRVEHDESFAASGMGLGLFITRSLVEAHGGHVWVESEWGSGSTFGFSLPLTTAGA